MGKLLFKARDLGYILCGQSRPCVTLAHHQAKVLFTDSHGRGLTRGNCLH